jgi:N-methylhydantoinase B/oxoprolinase/acetone carboxylase alpha subunit
MADFKKHREFIHDISNQLAIAEGAVKRVKKLKAKDQTTEILAEIDKNLDLSEKYSSTCIALLKEYRTYIHLLESQSS